VTRYIEEPSSEELSPADYRALADFRFQIRRFLRFSEDAARAAGIEPQQHQLLLAVKGLPDGVSATIGELATRLQIQHHSAVELVGRLTAKGAVERIPGEHDRRQVVVRLTRSGEALLRKLSLSHHEELEKFGPELGRALQSVMRRVKRAHESAV
jgi:DNA-binding MarR family transcriptional regulator